MLREMIDRIIDLSAPGVSLVNDGEKEGMFTRDNLHQVRVDDAPPPPALVVHTLSGLVDYCNNDLDNASEYTIHVKSHEEVVVYGEYERKFGRRKRYLVAEFQPGTFQFGQFYPQEDFVINMQSQFVMTDTMKDLLAIVGNVSSERINTLADNGYTQTVTAKAGIVNKENIELPNPVFLAPYRTFPEVTQQVSPFILRAREGSQGPMFALFVADGGFWKVETVKTIRDHLQGQLTDFNTAEKGSGGTFKLKILA